MELQDVSEKINSISSELVFFDEDTAAADWEEVSSELSEIISYAKENNIAVLTDAAVLCNDFVKAFSEKQITRFDQAMEYLSTLLTIMTNVADNFGDDNVILPSFKNELAGMKVFLDDLSDDAHDHEEEEAGDSDEDEEFLQLMLQRIDTVESILLELNSGELARQPVKDIFREFHTLKGETGILGMDDLHEFFHSAESALEPLRNDAAVVTDDFVSSLMAVNDISRTLLKGDDRLIAADGEEVKSAISTLAGFVKEAWERGQGVEEPEVEEEDEDDFFGGAFDDEKSDDGEEVVAGGTAEKTEPDYAEHFAEKISEQLPGFAEETDSAAESSLPDDVIEEEPVPDGEKINYIPLDVKKIDSLLDLVANTTAAANQLIQNDSVKKIPHDVIGEDLVTLERAVSGLQNLTVGLRMMPVRSLFQAMRRVAYDVGRSSHKRVSVKMEGAETEVDRTVLENITGAFTHLVRNSIDHGIEAPSERRQRSKPERGIITFKAYRNSGNIVFEIEDDGKGLNKKKIRNKAIEKGLISEDRIIDDEALYSLIFKTGFSTAEKVTGVSGRGVGMEAVKSSIEALRGRINVSSKEGQGTVVKITLPLSLSSLEGLLVLAGKSHYIIPAHSVRECFKAEPGMISGVEGRGKVVSIRGGLLPIVTLGHELGIDYLHDDPCEGVLVVIEGQQRMAALLVDDVLRTRQIMVRPLEGQLSGVPHVSGSADLGGRKIGFVLDFNEILEKSSVDNKSFGVGNNSYDKIETVDIGSNQVGMVDFYIDHIEGGKARKSSFAINAFKAKEFVTSHDLTDVPGAPKGFEGMLLLRNQTIPVVGLAELLGFNEREGAERIIIICEFGSHTIGITVNGVNRVNYISWSDILPPPDHGCKVDANYIVGTILMGEDVAFVLDFEHIVQEVLKIYLDVGESFDGVEQRKKGSRVLLVEDSDLVRKKIASALTEAGLNVDEAPNGQVALDKINALAEKIKAGEGNIFDYLDIVVSDIEMPQLDGYTLTRSIKANPHLVGLPVILHSSLTNDTIVKRAKEVHADGVVGKKDPAELAAYLKQHL